VILHRDLITTQIGASNLALVSELVPDKAF